MDFFELPQDHTWAASVMNAIAPVSSQQRMRVAETEVRRSRKKVEDLLEAQRLPQLLEERIPRHWQFGRDHVRAHARGRTLRFCRARSAACATSSAVVKRTRQALAQR